KRPPPPPSRGASYPRRNGRPRCSHRESLLRQLFGLSLDFVLWNRPRNRPSRPPLPPSDSGMRVGALPVGPRSLPPSSPRRRPRPPLPTAPGPPPGAIDPPDPPGPPEVRPAGTRPPPGGFPPPGALDEPPGSRPRNFPRNPFGPAGPPAGEAE